MGSEYFIQYALNWKAIANELLFIEETHPLIVLLVNAMPMALDYLHAGALGVLGTGPPFSPSDFARSRPKSVKLTGGLLFHMPEHIPADVCIKINV